MTATETDLEELRRGTDLIKRGFAQMQKGGVIMDVVNPEQARIAEDAGAVAVMALEAVPADIRKRGGVARMADPADVEEIVNEVSIPVMGKSRIGHTKEAQILEAVGVDMIDESEVLTPADDAYHIDKRDFTAPFVCGARNLGEALRRIEEGAAMIRTKGEAAGLRNIRVSQAWMNIETASHSPPEAATRRVTDADEAGHTDTTPADRLPISGLSRRQQSIATLDPSRLMSGFVLRILNRHQQAELTYRRFHHGRRDEPLPEESITESADSIPGRPPLSYLASVTDDDRGGLGFGECDKLVAHVDERLCVTASAQLEGEQGVIKRERLIDIANLEGDVVGPDESRAVRCCALEVVCRTVRRLGVSIGISVSHG